MNTRNAAKFAGLAFTVAAANGCALLGPTCVARQERGSVVNLQGEVGTGQMVSHLVPYNTSGSQNDGRLTWGDQFLPSGSRLRAFATRADCTDFQPPPAANGGACAILASAGWTPMGIAGNLIVTHGRGNPERLGSPPEYKIWIVGDPDRTTRYEIEITWFYGPDC